MIERELVELSVEWPEEGDLRPRLRARLAESRPPRHRRALLVATAALVVAIGIGLAVPPARSAVLRWLGLEGVTIEYVDRLPSVPVHQEVPLGPRTTMDEARRAVRWHILTSSLLGPADEVHLNEDQVEFLYRRHDGVKLLVAQAPGYGTSRFLEKMILPGTHVSAVSVNGEPGYYLFGQPHVVLYVRPSGYPTDHQLYLAGNTIVWEQGPLTLRLEGKLTREQALEIARSFR